MLRPLFLALGLGIALLLSSCATQPPAPKTILVPEARLAKLIAGHFPFNKTVRDVLDIQFSTPRLELDPLGNRINTSLMLGVGASGLLGILSSKTYQGKLDLSYGLRFEPKDGSVRLNDVKVAHFSVDGAPEALQRLIEKHGAALTQKLLDDYPIYKLKAEDLRTAAGQGYQPGALKIVPEGLSITLDPLQP